MTTRSHLSTLLIAATLVGGVAIAHAQDHERGQHPAVIVHARAVAIDPNLFIVAPPASTSWAHVHANRDHPAVQVARLAASRPGAVDGNTFTVQPPASVTWTVMPSESVAAALVAQGGTAR